MPGVSLSVTPTGPPTHQGAEFCPFLPMIEHTSIEQFQWTKLFTSFYQAYIVGRDGGLKHMDEWTSLSL